MRKILKTVLAFTLSLLFIAVASDLPTQLTVAVDTSAATAERQNEVALTNGADTKFAENDNYKLTIQSLYEEVKTTSDGSVATSVQNKEDATAQSMIIKLTDKKTGAVWQSNPTHPTDDGMAINETIDALRSHFIIDYYDTNGNLKTMNSYSDCLKHEFDEEDAQVQYKIYAIDNGVAIVYSLGSYAKTRDLCPFKMTSARFSQFFLSGKLSAEEEETIKDYYKEYPNDNMWSIRPKGKNNFRTILEYLDKVGYTNQDLVDDNDQFGIPNTSAVKAYFTVTVEYTITDEGLKVNVPIKELICDDKFPIYEITPLPYFGAVREPLETDDYSYMPQTDADGNQYAKSEIFEMALEDYSRGYIFVPDGSGAIIQLNARANANYYYSQSIYGVEKTLTKNTQITSTTQSLNAAMPVFGMSDGDNGFLAIIESSESVATINAYRARYRINQNYVNATFRVYNIDYVYLENAGEMSTVPLFQQTLHDEDYTISYNFLSDSPTYVDMAKVYRNYLEKTGEITKLTQDKVEADEPVAITTIGGVYGYKSFIGISYRGLISATTYEQNIDILKAVSDRGIKNIDLRLVGWFNNGVKHGYPSKIKLDSVLGGKSGMNTLIDYANENNIMIYPDVDFMGTYAGGNGYSDYSYSAKSIEGTYTTIKDISYATTKAKSGGKLKSMAKKVLSPKKYLPLTEKFLDKFEDYDFKGISLRSSANELYSDYNKDQEFDRVKTQDLVEQHLEQVSSKVENVMTNAANAYAFKYTDTIVNAPTDYSWYYVTDKAVPFYQIVLHGYITMQSTAINLTADYDYEVLRAIEYGTSINFELIYSDGSVLSNTEYTDNYSPNYEVWLDTIEKSYKMVNEALGSVQTETIEEHTQIADGVSKTTYSNGTSVYVNYNTEDTEVDGITVAARNIAVKGA